MKCVLGYRAWISEIFFSAEHIFVKHYAFNMYWFDPSLYQVLDCKHFASIMCMYVSRYHFFTFFIILYMLTFCNINYIYCQPPYHLLTCEHYSAVQCMYAHIFTQLVCACVHRINFWQPFQLCILFVKTLYFKLLFIWGLFINYFCVQMMQL